MLQQALRGAVFALMYLGFALGVQAAPYAALVVDARTGQVLHARNADTRLHPASLTKMMTLYVTFEAVRLGEIGLETKVKISKKAAAEPPSKLGMRAGQFIKLKYLIRAASVKSANDAATALAEAVSGSEAAFARRMNRTAKAMGMTRTTFKNAHGLTENGHLSTARDMVTLGRHLFFDYPQYYNLFSRRSTFAGTKEVRNTNRKFLAAYRGADGIKTGYTRAAGFNLVGSAQRGDKRIIAAIFGGRSTADRNARMAELLDMGFKRSPTRVATLQPALPVYRTRSAAVVTTPARSPRPHHRPSRSPSELAKLEADIGKVLAEAIALDDPDGESITLHDPPKARARRDGLQVVTRMSTSGGKHWGITLGAFPTRTEAEKILLRTALQDLSALDGALRKVVHRSDGYRANFVGLNETMALKACARLRAYKASCQTLGP